MENKTYHTAQALLDEINAADAICVGGASGMSAAAGYIWYRDDAMFRKYFGAFAEKYGIDNIFNGFYYNFPSREERWAYIATIVHFVKDVPIGQPYKDLHTLLRGKNYFIVTTNQDTQFSQEFGDDKVAIIQGDWRYFQCSSPCHHELYPTMEISEKLYNSIQDCKVDPALIPKCSHCGKDLEPWVRGYHFLQGNLYEEQYKKWRTFLEQNKSKRILFLELGVGRMTPMFIQEPFWNMTYTLPNARYVTINPKDALMPKEIAEKGIAIHEDIASVLSVATKL